MLDLEWGRYRCAGKMYEAIDIEEWKNEVASLGGDEALCKNFLILSRSCLAKMETQAGGMILASSLAHFVSLKSKDTSYANIAPVQGSLWRIRGLISGMSDMSGVWIALRGTVSLYKGHALV